MPNKLFPLVCLRLHHLPVKAFREFFLKTKLSEVPPKIRKLFCLHTAYESKEAVHASEQQALPAGRRLLHWPEIGKQPKACRRQSGMQLYHELCKALRREKVEQKRGEDNLELLRWCQGSLRAYTKRNSCSGRSCGLKAFSGK